MGRLFGLEGTAGWANGDDLPGCFPACAHILVQRHAHPHLLFRVGRPAYCTSSLLLHVRDPRREPRCTCLLEADLASVLCPAPAAPSAAAARALTQDGFVLMGTDFTSPDVFSGSRVFLKNQNSRK